MLTQGTEIIRATVDQQIRRVLGPGRSTRDVQLLIPDSPELHAVVLDASDDGTDKFGANRDYHLPLMPPGTQIQFKLQPNQTLWAAAAAQYALLTLIVEHVEDDG